MHHQPRETRIRRHHKKGIGERSSSLDLVLAPRSIACFLVVAVVADAAAAVVAVAAADATASLVAAVAATVTAVVSTFVPVPTVCSRLLWVTLFVFSVPSKLCSLLVPLSSQ